MNKRSSTRNPIAARSSRKSSRRRLLAMEWLEDRKLLTNFTVNNTLDDGSVGSLRWAVGQANSTSGANTIAFDATVFATPQTITLATGVLTLTDTTGYETITGPAAGVTISGNNASGVFSINSAVTAIMSGLTITGGNAANGGGVDNLGHTTLTNSTLTSNTATSGGGAVFSSGTITLTNDTLTSNTSHLSGGGMFASGTTTLTDCTISGNTSSVDRGGGVYNYGLSATVTLNGDTLSGNYAGYRGGGFGNMRGHAALTDCTISGNSLSSGSASGGGGTFNKYGTTTLTNCTIASNTSVGGFKAGGVFNVSGTTTLIDCTVSGNIGQSATNGTGIFNQTGTTNLVNTIVAGTVGHTDVEGTFTSQGHNLIGNIGGSGVSSGWVASDLTGTPTALRNAQLGPLANNGGPTQTEALLPTSPALNAGNPALAPATDERGLARFGNTDIGAYEDDFKVFTTADSGPGSLRSAIANANLTAGAIAFTSVFNTPQTILLTSGQLTLANTTGTEAIVGPAVGVTVSDNGTSRVFQVNSGVTASMSGLTITGGNSSGLGGGIFNSGTLNLSNFVVSGNSATAAFGGGGIANNGTITLTNGTISGNSTNGGGGGLSNIYSGVATLTNITVSGNTGGTGGGVDSDGGNSGGPGLMMSLIDCTITGNHATVFGGGGVYAIRNGAITLTDCTVTGNTSTTTGPAHYATGGGLKSSEGAVLTLANTIVAGNTAAFADPDAATPVTSMGHNLIGATDGSTGWVGSDLTGTVASPLNAQLGALASNGGTTQTIALLPNSPAINAGNSALAPTTDARGQTRFGSTDIGAFEYQFKVTTNADSGNGSLRQAITNANTTPGTDTVVFRIGTGLQTISPTSALPTITDTIIIDGTTQPGFAGTPLIQIDGRNAGAALAGLDVAAVNSIIKGLIVSDFNTTGASGIIVGSDVTIQGNWIGLNATGTAAAPNFHGIGILGSGALIGTNGDGVNDTAERNVISGNSGGGVYSSGSSNTKIAGNYIGTNVAGNAPLNNGVTNVFFAFSDGTIIGVDGSNNPFAADERNVIDGGIQVSRSTVIAGNYIGLNAAGTAALSNASNVGISFGNATAGARIGTNGDGISDDLERNVISGINGAGIAVGSAGSLVIAGNYIGTDFTGTSAIPNQVGISLVTSSSGVRIGTNGTDVDAAAEGNVISGNTLGGVQISTGSNNLVEGNLIGTDYTGKLALGNTQFGIQISNSANNTIGGMTTGAGNTIASTKVLTGSPTSGWGIEVVGTTSSGSVIQGNTIGGLPGLGNAGIGISDDLATITIGGIDPGEGNVIGYNGGFGVSLTSTASADSEVRQNRIIGNTAGGISIGASGSAYNPPVLTEATIVGGVLTVKGAALAGAVLEFFVSASGQGAVYLGTATEGSLADSNSAAGSFEFSIVMPAGVTASAGDSITAISVATPISGTNPNLQNTTSKFALSVVSDSGPAFGGPVVNAGGGGTIVAGSTFTSQGSFTDTTSESWTATVNYGDGTVTQALTINPVAMTAANGDDYSMVASATFNLSHVYAKAGSYAVVVSVKNDSGETGTSAFTVAVAAAPPTVDNTDIKIAPLSNPSNTTSPTIIDENQSVVLTGKFADKNPGATHTVSIIWGDNSTSLATVDEANGTFCATHPYLAPGTYNSASGIYTVEVTVNSSVGTTASTTQGLFYVQVNDVPPSNLVVSTDHSTISEGGAVNLSGSFQATGPLDTHVVTIDWGDKSPVKTFNLAGGVLNFSGISHQYLDYAAGAAGTPYTISVSVNDLYQPLAPAKATTTVLVNPVAPSQVVLTPSHSSINEGQSIALAGSFVAPGPLDHHSVSINWGDGTNPTIVSLKAGVDVFAGVNHTYASNSLHQAGGDFAITATIIDPARPTGTGVGTTSVVVNDVASTVSNLAVTYLGGGAIPIVAQTGGGTAPQVNAGSTITLTGSYTTPNPKDTYSLLVSWGDGTTSTVPTSYFASHTFVASHLFADSAPGTLVSLDDVHVTVTDSENTTGSGNLNLAVAHVAPVDQIGSGGISTSGSQILSAQISGGDTSPITYSWTINGVPQSNSTPNLTLPSTMDTSYIVESTATDSHGASSQFAAQVDVLDNTSSIYQVPNPGSGVNAVFVSALSGNHVIAGGTIATDGGGNLILNGNGVPELSNALTVPIIFDGNGQETYIGDAANDVFNLHTDQSKAYGEGGNNVFNLTPNCTLFAVADGGQNTINFSSSTYGVTFDLTQTSGQVQDVDPVAQPGDHFVSVDATGGATFPTLVDSSGGGDTITAASNTTIVGMGGSDKVLVNSSASTPVGNVTVAGAADGDTLTTTGPSIGSINFQGDSGTDTLTNMGTITGTVSFNGGADAGTLTNLGTIAGTVTFTGGADGGTLTNMGTVTGTVVFGGGSDADSLVNDANATLGTVVFNGDQGVDSFLNSGAVGAITYNGGSDADSLTNMGAVGTITFNGSSDAGTLTNDGTVTGSVTYTGGSDTGTIVNDGTVLGTVTYGGGSDADSFTNMAGASVGSIVFSGGSDAGTLTNDGTVSGTITYTGGSDAGTLINDGTVDGTVTYGGGSDADSFTNTADASVGSIVFSGSSDAGTLTNDGVVNGTITYTGGSDAGTLTNDGTVTGSVTYTGGSDSDTLVNQGLVDGGITYTGGSDAGSLVNDGTVTGTVTYTGGSDSDSLTNNGTLGTVVYTGGSDAGTLTNNGAFGTITYTGGSDSDTLTNTARGSQAGTINFQGDDGTDQLVNLGTLAGVVYTGGSDSDTLLNPGTVSGSIVFNGDSGADLLENGATVNGVLTPGTVGSITFNAGADTDTLLNPGTVSGTIVFNGDGGAPAGSTIGAKELVNTGSAASITFNGAPISHTTNNFSGDGGADTLANYGTVGSIVFNGDGNADLLVNQAPGVGTITFNAGSDANVLSNTGSDVGTINFQGDDGTDTLVNTGSATGGTVSTIVYNGGSDTGTLINTGSGLASITYNGDEGSSTLINEGSNIAQITFGGGADGGAFLNAGNDVSTIVFTGGADANVFNNDGTQVGTITYKGDQGSGYFLNNGSVATINYTGGSDTDTLVNNGVVGTSNGGTTTGGINFTGDTGADGLLNTADGTINGLIFTGGSDADTLVNQGTLTNASANFQGDDGAGQFVNDVGGMASNITYNAGSDTDALINYGSLSNATYNGDLGVGSMYLDGTLNQFVTYNGGADGDELIIGPDAGVVSTINFNGDAGTDLLANEANGAQNITFQAGSDTANFWNFANNVTGLTFHGGSGADTFDNLGTAVSGIVFSATGDSGADSLYNSGTSVGTIVFSGGSDANVLTNSGDSTGSIVYTAGSDSDTLTNSGGVVQSITFNGDDGVDSLVNTGTTVGTITYNGGSDSDSLTNSGTVGTISFLGDGPSETFTDSGSVGNLVFDGGAGMASLIYSAIGAPGSTVAFNGEDGGNIFVDSGSAGTINVNLGSGNNQAVVMTGAAGNVTLTGGDGNNTYLFSGTPDANVTVNQVLYANAGTMSHSNGTPVFVPNPANPTGSNGGINTLDFSGYDGGGISLDIMNTSAQAQPGGLSVTLTDPEGISDVVGTQYADQIYGNLRPDVISTADLPDYRLAGQSTPAATSFTPDARTQWVYLDFDTYTVAGDQVYTAAERAEVLSRIEMDYYGPDPSNPSLPDFNNRWFDVDLTDNLSDIPSNLVSTGRYATLYFNRTPPSGLPGGEASQVDLGNTNFGGYASIQINGMVGGGGQPPAIDSTTGADNFAILSAKVGAHELAHLMGVRHSDAFGPIGFGVHTPPGSTAFNPTYDGADAAFETFDHLISSPATVGSTRFNDLRDLDFGPREAIKLAFASQGTTIVAPTGTQSTMTTALPITLAPLSVPNTDVNLPDIEKGMNFDVAALAVEGTIGLNPSMGLAAPDYYALTGNKGDVDTFEVDSQELGRLNGVDTIDSVLSVYNSSGTLVAFNDDQYEGTDSLIMDFVLPATGTYYVKVSSFAATPGDPEYDPTNATSPLNPDNLSSILNPLNPDFSQSALTSFLNAKAGTATGQYDLFIYRFGESDPTASDVHNVLVARGSGTTLSGSSGTDTLMGPAGTVFDDSDAGPGTPVSIGATVTSASVDLQSPFQDVVILTGPTGSSAWNATISYGDGTTPTVEQLAAGSSVALDHLYQATGSDTVTIDIQTSEGTFETLVPVSVILSQQPTEAITATGNGSQLLANVPVTFTASLQNPYVGVNYLATWTFTNTANPSDVLTQTQTVSTTTAAPTLAFSTSQAFAITGTYSVELTIEDLANGTSTTVNDLGVSPAQVTITQFIATTTTVIAPNLTYNGIAYAQATAKVVGTDQNVLGSPTVTYAYYNGADTGLTSPLPYVPTNAGTYQVVATFAGNSAYSPSTSQPVAFTIGQATLTVTIADASKVYGANDASSLTGTISGLQNNDAITATYASTGSGATANAGMYSITATLSGNATTLANYAVTYTNTAKTLTTGTLTITAAPLTVTIADASKVYGANDASSLTGTISGLQNNDAIAATYASTGSATTANVGTYTITAALSGNATTLADYVVTYTNTAKTLTTGTLTVTADHTTTTVTSTSGSSYWNTTVTFTASVANTDSSNSPLGAAEFYDGSTDLGQGTLVGSSGNQTTWTFATSSLSPGSHNITASYTPTPLGNGADFLASSNQSAPFSEMILGGPTTTTGSISAGTIFYGHAETFTAHVLVGTTPATGSVDFFDNTTNTDLGSATLNGSGLAALTTSSPLPEGTQSIALNFAGGNGYTPSSTTVSVVAQPSIYVLNATAAGAVNVSGSSMISVPGTVQVDSSSSSAIVLSGNTKITAATIGVVGGTSITGSSSMSGTLTKDSSVSDPLANLPIPSATGMNTHAAVNIGGVTSETISPGIYPSIILGGSARLTMLPGIYVITGGGFTLSGGSSVTGSGVMLYNAGSNYNGGSGSTFGAFSLSSGTFNLSPPTTGVYAGISLFQSRDNTRALSISGAVAANLGSGVIYAPNASLQLSGSAEIGTQGQAISSLIVNELVLSGNTGTYQLSTASDESGSDSSFNWITDPVLSVTAEDDTGEGLDPNEVADVTSAMAYLNQALASFGVDLSWVAPGTNADVAIHFATTTPAGNASDGVLGYTTQTNDVYFVVGWNYYTGSDPSQVGSNQYDFTTLATHELAHTIGLGESQDPSSVMYEYLAPGEARRTFTDTNLTLIDTDADRFMKVARALPTPTEQANAATPTAPLPLHAPVAAPSLGTSTLAFDLALAALDPTPDAASTLTSADLHRLDVAIDAIVQESYLVPLEIAQLFPDQASDEASPGMIRKPTTHRA
jgi:MBG domain (YGX type)/Right handed beta helix region/Matrixin